jgi:hypothetical protein
MEDLVDHSISVADLEVTLEQPHSYNLVEVSSHVFESFEGAYHSNGMLCFKPDVYSPQLDTQHIQGIMQSKLKRHTNERLFNLQRMYLRRQFLQKNGGFGKATKWIWSHDGLVFVNS